MFRLEDLIDPALVAPAFEGGLEPKCQNLVRQAERDNAPAHREDIRVVVLARQAGRIEIVTECGADAGHFVGGDLFALSAAAEQDTAVRLTAGDRAPDRDANRRIVDRDLVVRPVIVHRVAEPRKRLLQMLLEREPCMIGSDGDSHDARLYYMGSA